MHFVRAFLLWIYGQNERAIIRRLSFPNDLHIILCRSALNSHSDDDDDEG